MLAQPQAPLTLLLLLCMAVSGCSICANSHDCSYAAYGGVIQRQDRVHGRVGSLYGSQPIFVPGEGPPASNPTPAEPTPASDPDASTASPDTPPATPSPSDRPREIPQPPSLDELNDEFDAPPVPGDVL